MWLRNLNTDSPQTSIVRLQLDVHLWVQHDIKLRKDSRQRWICKNWIQCETSGSRKVCSREGPGGASGSGGAVKLEASMFESMPADNICQYL